MQIEQAIEYLKNYKYDNEVREAIDTLLNYIEIMHKEFDRLEDIEDNTAMLKYELEKKDNVISMMTGWIYADDTGFGYSALKDINTPEKIKEYFYKKVSDNK